MTIYPIPIRPPVPSPESVPRYKSFFKVIELLRCFQLEGDLQIGVKNGVQSVLKPPAAKPEEQYIAKSMQISFPVNEAGDELASLLPGTEHLSA